MLILTTKGTMRLKACYLRALMTESCEAETTDQALARKIRPSLPGQDGFTKPCPLLPLHPG